MKRITGINNLQDRLNKGSESVFVELDRHFRERLCQLVNSEMRQIFRRRQDPEDIVQSVLKSFCGRVYEGNFVIENTDALWALLKQISRNKVRKRIAKDTTLKRDIFAEQHGMENALEDVSTDQIPAHVLGEALGIAIRKSESPASEIFGLQLWGYSVGELVEIIMKDLSAPYPEILQLRLEGCSESEIASRLQCGREAIRYKLKRIQGRLKSLLAEQESM